MKKLCTILVVSAVSISAYGQTPPPATVDLLSTFHFATDQATFDQPLAVSGNLSVAGGLDVSGTIMNGADTVLTNSTGAAKTDARIVRAEQVVPSVAGLRSLSVPVAGSDSGTVDVLGYLAAGDTEPVKYAWDSTSVEADDAGRVINPTGHTGAGRWIMVWDRAVANVTHWGAGLGSGTPDDYASIMRAFRALRPTTYYTTFNYVDTTLPIVTGKLFFPTTARSYYTSNTIECSVLVAVEGDKQQPTITFLPASAPGTLTAPKYLLRAAPLAADTGANNEFNVQVARITLSGNNAATNPMAAGFFIEASEGSWLDALTVEACAQPSELMSARANVGTLSFDSRGISNPCLVLDGEGLTARQISCGLAYNIANVPTPVSDATGVMPALINNCPHVHIDTLNVEGSPLGVRNTADNFSVGTFFGNAMVQMIDIVAGSGVYLPNISSRNGLSPGTILVDRSSSYGEGYSKTITDDGSGRASYVQKTFVNHLAAGYLRSDDIANGAYTAGINAAGHFGDGSQLTNLPSLPTTGTSGTVTMVKNHRYVVNAGAQANLQLPALASVSVGDTVEVLGIAGGWKITQPEVERILGVPGTNPTVLSSTATSTGGYLESNGAASSVSLVYAINGAWMVRWQNVPGAVAFH